jgi:hypothetical protein
MHILCLFVLGKKAVSYFYYPHCFTFFHILWGVCRYGLGTKRNLDQLIEFTGVNLRDKTLSQVSRCQSRLGWVGFEVIGVLSIILSIYQSILSLSLPLSHTHKPIPSAFFRPIWILRQTAGTSGASLHWSLRLGMSTSLSNQVS